jgi:hypothetical protein
MITSNIENIWREAMGAEIEIQLKAIVELVV